jgi:hypothetical protein
MIDIEYGTLALVSAIVGVIAHLFFLESVAVGQIAISWVLRSLVQ